MKQALKNVPLKYKLITCFLLIISINAVSGLMGLSIMKELGSLVNKTYDKALMSGTFAQASKFDFSQSDMEFLSSLLAHTEEDFKRHLLKDTKAQETLLEDLAVVQERTLSPKSSDLIAEIRQQLPVIDTVKEEFAAKKRQLLKQGDDSRASIALIQEWEANKEKRKLYRKLTALYDDAAVVGYQFRLDSEAKNIRIFKQTMWILAGCILFSILLSVSVSFLIISPLLSLQSVCKTVGTGDYKVRAKIESTDELGTLASVFNLMLNTIEDKSENISSLLSSLPFGLFYFDKEGIISKERSQSTDKIFKDFANYQTLADFFGAHNCNTHQVNQVLTAVYQGIMPFNSAVFLFPKTIQVPKNDELRTVQLSFKPKYNSLKKLEKVIVIAEDITDKILAQEESKKLNERVERVSKVSSDLAGFKEFLPTVQNMYSSLIEKLEKDKTIDLTDLRRDLHSLKGILGIYAFKSCASGIHSIESFISEGLGDKLSDVLEKMKLAQGLFEEQAQDITTLLALNNDTGLKYYNESKINVIRGLAKSLNDPKLISAVKSIDKFPVDKVLAKYSNYAQTIAAKLDDKKIKIVFDPSDEVSYEEVQRLDSALVHVLNNSIDHGIETTSERFQLNKNEFGEIKISCTRNPDQSLIFKISDDGKGINGEYLLEKAVRMGMISEEKSKSVTEEEKINLIFASGLSSKDTSSEVSGRGIGMDAVKTYLESLGGSIQLFTQLGSGTTFSLNIPPLET